MGFWNALSVLAPVAPALSDAQDIRTDRQQSAAKFAQDQELEKARLTVQQLAADTERQRLAATSRASQDADTVRQQQGIPLRSYTSADGAQHTVYYTASGPKDVEDTPSGEERLKSYVSSLKGMGVQVTPEQEQALAPGFFGQKGPVASNLYRPLPGAAGQPRPAADGKGYVRDVVDPLTNQVIEQPMPADYKPAPAKPLSPAVRYTNLAAKQIMANQGKGPALTPEELADLTASRSELTLNGVSTANARAIANARYGITNVTDDSGEEVAQNRLNVANAAAAGTPYAAGAVGAPTGSDKKNSILAQSAIQQVNRMQALLRADPQLVGPGNGQLTRLQMWLGTQSPDAQQFLISSLLSSEHGVAVFGGRNIHTINDLQQALGSMKTNPAALSAALDVVKETMAPFATAGGRLPGARTPSQSPTGTGTPKTAADYLKSIGVQ